MASYRGLASLANPGIQRHQNPAVPRNSFTCLAEAGVGLFSIVPLWVSESYLWPLSRTYPRYITCCLQIQAFFAEALYPRLPRAGSRFSVPFRYISGLATAINRSSTYCNRLISGFWAQYSPKSSCRTLSKIVGEFLSPCGSLVQVNWPLIPIFESCHSKVK